MTLTKLEEDVIWKFNNGRSLTRDEIIILQNVVERAKAEKKEKSSNWLKIGGQVLASVALGAIGISWED